MVIQLDGYTGSSSELSWKATKIQAAGAFSAGDILASALKMPDGHAHYTDGALNKRDAITSGECRLLMINGS